MDNIVLINGITWRLIEQEIKKIINSDNIVYINYPDCDIHDILNEANYYSLMGDTKYIIVKHCSLFEGKDEKNETDLLSYMNNYNENSKIIFICNSVDSRKKIVKQIKENFKYIEIPKIDYKNVYEYINNYVSSEKYSIEYKASGLLVNEFGLDLDLIFNELDKMMLYYGKPSLIKYTDCDRIISHPLDSNCYHFIDACILKDYSRSLKLYKELKTYKIDESLLIIMLYKEYKKLYLVKKYSQLHYDLNKIAKEIGSQPWQVEKAYNNSHNYSKQELLELIKYLGVLDYSLKTGNSDKEFTIYNFLLKLMN